MSVCLCVTFFSSSEFAIFSIAKFVTNLWPNIWAWKEEEEGKTQEEAGRAATTDRKIYSNVILGSHNSCFTSSRYKMITSGGILVSVRVCVCVMIFTNSYKTANNIRISDFKVSKEAFWQKLQKHLQWPLKLRSCRKHNPQNWLLGSPQQEWEGGRR